jgi:hypothetical protein
MAAAAERFSTALHRLQLFLGMDALRCRIHHMLLVKVREVEGREASPTAAIIDTQAVKATEKGGVTGIRSDTTQERRPKASSAMSSSIRSASFSASR